ncbi:MAG: glycosyltransferase [Mollicutes bacterium]|nr:glycosyltransferase [Mollicutes bacterium]
MEIVFIGANYSGRGGTENVLTKVISYLSLNDKVIFYKLGKSKTNDWLKSINNTAKVIRYDTDNKFKELLFMCKIFLTLKDNTIVISTSPNFLKIAYLIRKIFNKKYKIVSYIHFSLENQDLFNKEVLKYADFHLAISSSICKSLIEMGIPKSKIFLIFNPISHKQDIISSPNNTKYDLSLAYVGRVYLEGQKNLVEAIKGIEKSKLNIHLDILGSGPDVNSLKEYIKDNKLEEKITLFGWVKNPWSILKNKGIDGLILTSRFEGLPMVLLEAMSYGIPCIVSDFEGFDDVLKPKVNGVYYKLNNIDDLENKFYIFRNTSFDPIIVKDSINLFYSNVFFSRLDQVLRNIYLS